MRYPRWVDQIMHEEPGNRFTRTYRRRRIQERGRPLLTVGITVAGLFLLAAGVLFMALPILPGFVLAIPGLAILLGSTRRGANFLDWAEVKIRAIGQRFRPRNAGK